MSQINLKPTNYDFTYVLDDEKNPHYSGEYVYFGDFNGDGRVEKVTIANESEFPIETDWSDIADFWVGVFADGPAPDPYHFAWRSRLTLLVEDPMTDEVLLRQEKNHEREVSAAGASNPAIQVYSGGLALIVSQETGDRFFRLPLEIGADWLVPLVY